jgi:hypothetical protein
MTFLPNMAKNIEKFRSLKQKFVKMDPSDVESESPLRVYLIGEEYQKQDFRVFRIKQ